MENKVCNVSGSKKTVVVFFTGGTIACSYDYTSSKIVPANNSTALLASLNEISRQFCIKAVDYCNVPSPHLTPGDGIKLAAMVREELSDENVCGTVIVQGTDTLEEFAYLFQLVIDTNKPIVFTGAMKSDHELYADALGNLEGAIQLAGCPKLYGYGVLVYFNQEFHSASYVTKTHSNNIYSFKSLECGALGTIINGDIRIFSKPLHMNKYPVDTLKTNVQLLKSCCGMDSTLLKACLDAGVDGVVIEALGAGNLPPDIYPWVKATVDAKIPVVAVTRCFSGLAAGLYDYKGGGYDLGKAGVIFGKNISGPKARIRLMVLTQIDSRPTFIEENFNE